MTSKPADPLLAAAKVVLTLAQAFILLATIGIGIGIGVICTVGRERVFELIGHAEAPGYSFAVLIASFLLIMVLLQLGFRFLRELRGIIESVSDGEPFRAENASRLSRMGWLSVGGHGIGAVLAGISAWLVPYLIKLEGPASKAHYKYDFGFGVGLGGILLTLILFILARVFREGARMRADLEGTV